MFTDRMKRSVEDRRMNFATAKEKLLVWSLTALAGLAAFVGLQLWNLVGEISRVNVNIATMLEKMSASDARMQRFESKLGQLDAQQDMQDADIVTIKLDIARHFASDKQQFGKIKSVVQRDHK